MDRLGDDIVKKKREHSLQGIYKYVLSLDLTGRFHF